MLIKIKIKNYVCVCVVEKPLINIIKCIHAKILHSHIDVCIYN